MQKVLASKNSCTYTYLTLVFCSLLHLAEADVILLEEYREVQISQEDGPAMERSVFSWDLACSASPEIFSKDGDVIPMQNTGLKYV